MKFRIFLKITGIALSLFQSTSLVGQSNTSGGGWTSRECGPVVTETSAIATCDARFPLPNPNPLGATDQASNCPALLNRCACYTPEYNTKTFDRIACVCKNSAANIYNNCISSSNLPYHADTVANCNRKAHDEYSRCTRGATVAAAGAAVSTFLDTTSCIAKFPFCVLNILPGPVRPTLPKL
jgi:hypothetical protein